MAAICALLTILGGIAGGLWWIGYTVGSTKTLVMAELGQVRRDLQTLTERIDKIEEPHRWLR